MRVDLDGQDVLFIPARPWPLDGVRQVAIETRQVASGEYVALAFTTPGKLASQLGESQPWVAMRAGDVEAELGAHGISRVLVDPGLPQDQGFWRWDRARLEQLTGDSDG
jgi:hypothetical protein